MKRNLNALSAWALAFGCSIGWGAFIMPGTTFLPKSGILGTAIGILIGAIIMVVIGRNYHTMITEYPDAGGAFTYTVNLFGYDHGFLCGWFLCLTYIALIWANASAMALLVRYTVGDVLQFGFHYQIAGYDVYFGECLLCIVMMALGAAACMFRKKMAYILEAVFAITLLGGVALCFSGAAAKHTGGTESLMPWFAPDTPAWTQIVRVVAIIPWAFVGFESISHSAEEFSFGTKKAWRIMILAVIASAVCYILMTLTAALVLPEGYGSWVDYIADLGNLSGRAAMPTFSATQLTFGRAGVVLMGCTMFSALFTSIIGNMIAASRMLVSFSERQIMPKWFGKLNRDGAPTNAILFLLLISLFIPFLGRTAVGWHVDVSNVGATVAYGYTSVAAWQYGRKNHRRGARICGMAGLALSGVFLILLLIPNYFSGNALEPESYLILSGWVVLGFALYRQIFKHDQLNRFGRTTAVWIALMFLGLFTALSWQRQTSLDITRKTLTEIEQVHTGVVHELTDLGAGSPELQEHSITYNQFLEQEMESLQHSHMVNSALVLGIVVLTVGILISNYSILSRKNQEQEKTIGVERRKANTDALTGVKNKTAFNGREMEINHQIQVGTCEPFGVVVCDVNNLKTVNDTLGHKSGDELIRQGCQFICHLFAHSPVYRIGGDEFAVLLEKGDYEIRERLVAEFAEQMEKNRKEGKIVVAMGMSEYDSENDHYLMDVFERADAAMYENKKKMKAKT